MINWLPDDITFREWVKFVFDHAESEGAWYNLDNRVSWDARARPLLTIQYMTNLFTNADAPLSQFSNLQLRHGLWYIADIACSNHTQVLIDLDNSVPMADRVKCIHSMFTLFEALFARRCAQHLFYQGSSDNPLNLICDMWWDLVGGYGWAIHPAWSDMNDAFLSTLTKILELDSVACRGSALHGLGHWQTHCRVRVWKIVTKFLKHHPEIDPNLRKFALDARSGNVM
jgi:hypothetical protein